jgi:anti-anti-sigma regulatory factor
MQYAVNLPILDAFSDPRTLVDLAKIAEAAGWDGVVVWDSLLFDQHWMPPIVDPWITLAAIATATERVKIGTMIAQLARRQMEVIRMQEALLRELSTPLIPISDTVLVMPLIGSIDSRRAQQVLETLLSGITGSKAEVAILGITGVSLVDALVANAILRAAQAVKLLGAQIILTGIRPEVAQTLVGLGADLGTIVTRSTLQSGIALAMHRD